MRKIVMRMLRRAQKVPEVQEHMKALQAAWQAAAPERYYANFEYMRAVGNEIAKSKWINYDAPPPEEMQRMRFECLLIPKIENGKATAGDIEEFRLLAEEVLRDPQCPPQHKQRIEAALRTAKPRP